ncbi:Predicted pyrophosphatase or phosphodiesterase, AlkP superfamily [Marivirga sericea]|uniref:Predicted pyrophosphatase or phosphodiesterase, AlkP superfamily n=1 Tax=Marivirga sericea TaxID=1028 RepID=A0A1X7KV55_9BACT|nr:ectonucleotide pyrophosphatase/phosphodiesterase [Marivirga sericea]SMG45310.1 Predicted pyrophosphatase or phosphodiesterase, AlkP superfamily [Marivirga sericea]
MNCFYKTLILSISILISFAASAQKQQVILISIDGLRPDFYLNNDWPAPILQHMAENGAHAKAVKGVFPSVTYPSHTTIITGMPPAKHGIYYNTPFEPYGATGRWYWEYETIKTPTLFSLSKDAGLVSAAISWPVSVGAPIDYNIPEVWSLEEGVDRFTPMKSNATPDGFLQEIETYATGKINTTNFGNGGYFAREQKFAAAASYIFEKYNPDLLAVHLLSADHFQHTDGREGFMPKRAVSAVDAAIGQILETVERLGKLENTTFIITGDHGFVDIHTKMAPNVLLKENALISEDEKDWKVKFHTSGAAAFLHLNKPDDSESVGKVKELLNSLPDSQKKLFRLVEKEELESIGADPKAMLAIAPNEGISMTSTAEGALFREGSGGTHGFFPEHENIYTGFIAFGGKANKKTVLKEMYLTDIAPVIAEILGLSLKDVEGVLYPGILKK